MFWVYYKISTRILPHQVIIKIVLWHNKIPDQWQEYLLHSRREKKYNTYINTVSEMFWDIFVYLSRLNVKLVFKDIKTNKEEYFMLTHDPEIVSTCILFLLRLLLFHTPLKSYCINWHFTFLMCDQLSVCVNSKQNNIFLALKKHSKGIVSEDVPRSKSRIIQF